MSNCNNFFHSRNICKTVMWFKWQQWRSNILRYVTTKPPTKTSVKRTDAFATVEQLINHNAHTQTAVQAPHMDCSIHSQTSVITHLHWNVHCRGIHCNVTFSTLTSSPVIIIRRGRWVDARINLHSQCQHISLMWFTRQMHCWNTFYIR